MATDRAQEDFSRSGGCSRAYWLLWLRAASVLNDRLVEHLSDRCHFNWDCGSRVRDIQNTSEARRSGASVRLSRTLHLSCSQDNNNGVVRSRVSLVWVAALLQLGKAGSTRTCGANKRSHGYGCISSNSKMEGEQKLRFCMPRYVRRRRIHQPHNLKVIGSNPILATNLFNILASSPLSPSSPGARWGCEFASQCILPLAQESPCFGGGKGVGSSNLPLRPSFQLLSKIAASAGGALGGVFARQHFPPAHPSHRRRSVLGFPLQPPLPPQISLFAAGPSIKS